MHRAGPGGRASMIENRDALRDAGLRDVGMCHRGNASVPQNTICEAKQTEERVGRMSDDQTGSPETPAIPGTSIPSAVLEQLGGPAAVARHLEVEESQVLSWQAAQAWPAKPLAGVRELADMQGLVWPTKDEAAARTQAAADARAAKERETAELGFDPDDVLGDEDPGPAAGVRAAVLLSIIALLVALILPVYQDEYAAQFTDAQVDPDIAALTQRIADLESRLAAVETTATDAPAPASQAELAALTGRLDQVTTDTAGLRQRLTDLEAAANAPGPGVATLDQVEQVRADLATSQAATSGLQARLDGIEADIRTAFAQEIRDAASVPPDPLRSLTNQVAVLEQQLEAVNGLLAALDRRIDGIQATASGDRLTEIENRLTALSQRTGQADDALEADLAAAIAEVKAALAARKEETSVEIAAEFATAMGGVRAVDQRLEARATEIEEYVSSTFSSFDSHVAEQLSGLREQITQGDADLSAGLKALGARLDATTGAVDETIATAATGLETRLNDGLSALSSRVDTAETSVANALGQLETLQASVVSRVAAVEEQVTPLAGQIAAMAETRLASQALATALANLQGQVAAAQPFQLELDNVGVLLSDSDGLASVAETEAAAEKIRTMAANASAAVDTQLAPYAEQGVPTAATLAALFDRQNIAFRTYRQHQIGQAGGDFGVALARVTSLVRVRPTVRDGEPAPFDVGLELDKAEQQMAGGDFNSAVDTLNALLAELDRQAEAEDEPRTPLPLLEDWLETARARQQVNRGLSTLKQFADVLLDEAMRTANGEQN